MQLDIGMVFSSLIGLFLLMGVGWVSVKTKIVPPAASAPMSSLLLKVTLPCTIFSSLATREFEPDGPNYTPRISGILFPCGSYVLSILKSLQGDPSCCVRNYFTFDAPKAGMGHLIHTYESDGAPLPSFCGEPRPVAITGTLDQFTQAIWESLNEDNKVSLFVRSIELETGTYEDVILNKYTAVEG